MASIKQRGDSYLVTVSMGYDIKGKKITKSKTFTKPDSMTSSKWDKEIQKLAIQFESEIQVGLYLNSDVTLEDFTKRWFKEYGNIQLKTKTINSFKYELDTKILPALGHLKLDKITPVNILSFLNNLLEDGVRLDGKKGGYSNKTVKYQWQILSSIFQQAVYWQVIPDNPCKRIKCPQNQINNSKQKDRTEFLDEYQTLMLLDIIRNEDLKYQLATNIVVFCGLRNGELLGLTWNDIDFDNKKISINKTRNYTPDMGMYTSTTKTDNSNRILNIPDILVKQLREYKLYQNGEKAKCGDLWNEEWEDNPWLMTQWDGKGMHYNTISSWLSKFLKRYNKNIINDVNISEENKAKFLLPVISIHKLRHTSATLLIGQNTDIKTVSARLGHSQTSTTMNIYVHGLNTSDVKAANNLEDLLGKKHEPNDMKNA